MGIREQGYRHWQGQYTGHALRWWTVAKQALRATFFNKMRLVGFLMFIMVIWAFPFFYGIFWFFGGAAGGEEILLGSAGCPDTDCTLRQNLYDLVRAWEVLWVPVFIGMVAAPLVANDLRSNALYIYLSKPMLRRDYIMGKLAATMILGLPVTVLPNIFVWMMAMGSRDELTKIDHPYEILMELLYVQLAFLAIIGMAVLAASSLTKKWWIAFASVLGGYFILFTISNFLQEILGTRGQIDRTWILISPATNFINFAKTIYERPPGPPSWELSFLILLAILAGSIATFLWRILKLEVTE